MNLARVKYNNIANGVGVRTAIFVSGCNHACKGCFNREIWAKNTGKPFKNDDKIDILLSLKPSYISGLSLLGGEPMMDYNIPELIDLCKEVRELYPSKTIWVYSGYTYEQIIAHPKRLELLKLCDVLVDGKYEEELYSPLLKFRGSANQRVIKVQESLASEGIVLYCD